MWATPMVAVALGISEARVRRLAAEGRLHRAGGTVRYPQYDQAEVMALHAELWPDGAVTSTNAQRTIR